MKKKILLLPLILLAIAFTAIAWIIFGQCTRNGEKVCNNTLNSTMLESATQGTNLSA